MSVTNQVNATVVLVNRYTDNTFTYLSIQKDASILARWYGRVNVAGDGSGGAYFLNINMFTTLQVLGANTMWDLQWFNCLWTAPLVAPVAQLIINVNEPVDGVALGLNYTLIVPAGINAATLDNVNPVKGMKWVYQYQQAQYPNINLTVQPNTVGVTAFLQAGGYIYNEKYI